MRIRLNIIYIRTSYMRLILFPLLLLQLWSCSAVQDTRTGKSPSLSGTRWALVSIEGDQVPNLPTTIYLEFTDYDLKRFTGFAGCNHIFGNYRIDGSKLILSDIGSTKVTCHYQELENSFIQTLGIYSHFRVTREQLTLFRGNTIAATFRSM